jgi:putative tricarboxylic transport membrane protein
MLQSRTAGTLNNRRGLQEHVARRLVTTVVIAFGWLAIAPGARAAYPEKNIEVIIPYAAGGGFDNYVRGVLPALAKHLPREVNLIPRNMPGAGGRKGATAVYRAKPDGYTIGAFNLPGLMLPQLLGEPVTYDLSRVTWLGRISEDQYALVVASSSDIASLADLKGLGRTVKVASTGVASSAQIASVIAFHLLGIDASLITGYEGSQAYLLAVMRGDGDAALAPTNSLSAYADDLRVIASFERESTYPGLPTPATLAAPDLARLTVQRVLGAPPDLDPEAHRVLTAALAQALADSDLKAWSASVGLPLAPLSAADTAALYADQQSLYEKYKDIL